MGTGLTGYGKVFREDLIEAFAFRQTRLELLRFATQLLIAKAEHLLFKGVNDLHSFEHALNFTLVLATKEFL